MTEFALAVDALTTEIHSRSRRAYDWRTGDHCYAVAVNFARRALDADYPAAWSRFRAMGHEEAIAVAEREYGTLGRGIAAQLVEIGARIVRPPVEQGDILIYEIQRPSVVGFVAADDYVYAWTPRGMRRLRDILDLAALPAADQVIRCRRF